MGEVIRDKYRGRGVGFVQTGAAVGPGLDSANDGRARLSFHTSFDNPLTLGAPPRESIEVRTLVFFSPAA